MRHRSTGEQSSRENTARSSEETKTATEIRHAPLAGDKMLSRDPVSLGSDLEILTRARVADRLSIFFYYFIRKPAQVGIAHGIACYGEVAGCDIVCDVLP